MLATKDSERDSRGWWTVKNRIFGKVSAGLVVLFFFTISSPAPEFKVPNLTNFLKGKGNDKLQVVDRIPTGPGGLCQLPNGDYIISCHQFFGHQYRVMRKTKENWTPFPNLEMNQEGKGAPIVLDSVLGVVNDGYIVWMLDNGRRTGKEPKLVAWDARKDRLHRIIPLSLAKSNSSMLKNLILDSANNHIYISDPADGVDSAIIVVDLQTSLARRVLHGHKSVVRDPSVKLVLDGKEVKATRADGKTAAPLSGVSPFAIDRKGWLYYGPRNSSTLYRIKTELLRQSDIKPTALQAHVEEFSAKPVCDSIVIDSKNRIYFSDISNSAVTYVTPDDRYLKIQSLVKDPRMMWPGGLTFGTDGQLHFFCNQLNRAPIFNDNRLQTSSPFYLFKINPLPVKRLNLDQSVESLKRVSPFKKE